MGPVVSTHAAPMVRGGILALVVVRRHHRARSQRLPLSLRVGVVNTRFLRVDVDVARRTPTDGRYVVDPRDGQVQWSGSAPRFLATRWSNQEFGTLELARCRARSVA